MSFKGGKKSRAGLSLIAIMGATLTVPGVARAQSADQGADAIPGDIVITARKRNEDILKTPVAVAVMTGDDIVKKGVISVADLAANTPGMNVNGNSAGRNDRSFQQIIIRGFTSVNTLQTTVSTFIDGAPVSSPSAVNSISDPARIEVLKGPQSAYFGRNTFAGAVNVVTKEPNGEWGGSISGMVGTRDNYKLHADIQGPLLGDKIDFRVTGDRFSKSGSYRNAFNPSQTLGDQSTNTYTAALVAKPFEGLTIKGFGMYSHDKDGAPAQGFISAYELRDSSGNIVVSNQSNCTLNGVASGTVGSAGSTTTVQRRAICGVAPGLINSPSANATLTDATRTFLASTAGRVTAPGLGTQNYGLVRDYNHEHLSVDYALGQGFTLSSITSWNHEQYSQMADIDNYGSTSVPNTALAISRGATTYYDQPYIVERRNSDFSQEVRASFDNQGPFKGTVGVSYLNNWVVSDLGGGSGGALGIYPSAQVVTSGKSESYTKGAFFGLSYRLFDALTLNGEGRYQIDTLYAFAPPTGTFTTTGALAVSPFGVLARKTYKNFLPRLIAQYDVTPQTMVYASWAKGVNPAQFNTLFLTAPPATVRAAVAAGFKVAVDPEKVTNYEIGLKGSLFGRRLRYTLAAYYAEWRNQINTLSVSLVDPDTQTTQAISAAANAGSVNLKGVEGDFSYVVNDLITLNAAGAINETEIQSYVNSAVSLYTGIFNFKGKEMPLTSKYSASAGIQFGGELHASEPARWYVRGDYVYKSGVWSDAANIVRTPDNHRVNFRGGVEIGRASVALFVKNAFNSKSYTSIADSSLLEPTNSYNAFTSALVVSLPELRTIGMETKLKF